MSGIKFDLVWSPHHINRYLTVSTDLQLYEIEEVRDGFTHTSAVQVSDNFYANLLAANSDYPFLKCISWYPKQSHNQLFAVGLANGKVILHNLGESMDDMSNFGAKEFLPKHIRPCNCLSWNANDPKLLACGMEKNRADFGLLIWDVTRRAYSATDALSPMEKHHSHMNMFAVDNSNMTRPIPAVELALSDSIQSLHWFNQNPHLIVCGVNGKHIQIYDTRDPVKAQNTTPAKAVYGLCVDPYYEHRLSSFVENHFVIWDIRNFEKPLVTTHKQKPILKICWCPTRSSVLAALTKDSSSIELYNIQSSMGNDEVEPTIVERNVQPFNGSNIMSFAWHPTHENRMITVAQNRSMCDYTVYDRITINWSPRSEIVWAYGKKLLHFVKSSDKFHPASEDISIIMRRRACNGYGMKMPQVWVNGTLSGDPALYGVWVWIDLVKEHRQDKKLRNTLKYEGVHTIICGENGQTTLSNSESRQAVWIGLNFSSCKIVKYFSEERERALQLCCWGSEADSSALSYFLERLEDEGHYLRAAFIAVFNLNIRKAIEILNRGASQTTQGSTDLNAIAMALAGYTEEKTALWLEISSNLKSRFTDPHLRAMFTFLTEEVDSYDEILNEYDIAVQDRLSIALMYLPDRKLAEFLDRLKTKMLEVGKLDGMLLTGLTTDGLALLQKYVDRTADVQTASLILMHTLPSNLSQHHTALSWIDAYRELLDVWRLWKQRALFDVHWFKSSPLDNKPLQQVFVTCTYCGKSLSSYLQHMSAPSSTARYSQMPATSGQKVKVTCCPNCRKPLPRCSLCLSRMGTPAGLHWKRPIEGKPGKKLTEFSNWLTWCQTCRHGGHSVHILGWFEEHSECPVTGCTCKCMSLDAVAKMGFSNTAA